MILAKSKKRPLLFKKDIKSTVNKIYLERKKIYSQSDFRIKCDFLKTDINPDISPPPPIGINM